MSRFKRVLRCSRSRGALVAAQEVEAGDVVACGWEAGVFRLALDGRFGLAG